MKNILLLCVVLVAGCTSVPVPQKFPDAPEVLQESCGKLDTIDKPTVLLSELMKTVSKNYKKFHDCSTIVDAWAEWYAKQKKIFQEVNH